MGASTAELLRGACHRPATGPGRGWGLCRAGGRTHAASSRAAPLNLARPAPCHAMPGRERCGGGHRGPSGTIGDRRGLQPHPVRLLRGPLRRCEGEAGAAPRQSGRRRDRRGMAFGASARMALPGAATLPIFLRSVVPNRASNSWVFKNCYMA